MDDLWQRPGCGSSGGFKSGRRKDTCESKKGKQQKKETSTLMHGGLSSSRELVQLQRLRALNHWKNGNTLLSQLAVYIRTYILQNITSPQNDS